MTFWPNMHIYFFISSFSSAQGWKSFGPFLSFYERNSEDSAKLIGQDLDSISDLVNTLLNVNCFSYIGDRAFHGYTEHPIRLYAPLVPFGQRK